MTKPDQNRVNLGPARIKTDDAIYDAVDQGIVGTTTTTTVVAPTDPGFVPIGPIGDLITPPILDPLPGYPIYATDIGLNDGITTNPYLSYGSQWAIMDLSSIGSFTNALVVETSSSDLLFINFNNPSQQTVYAGQAFGAGAKQDYIIRGGVLTRGWSSFVGGDWVLNGDVDITFNSTTETVLAGNISASMNLGKSDATYRYLYLGFGWGGYHLYGKISHTGPRVIEVIGAAPVGFNAGLSPNETVAACAGGVLWIRSRINSPFSEKVFALNTTTGSTTPVYNITSYSSYSNSWFGLNNGSFAYLRERQVGIPGGVSYIYDLHILGLDGGLTTQTSLMTLTGPLVEFAPLVGGNSTFAVGFTSSLNTSARILYQISSAGYQVVSGTPHYFSSIRITDSPAGRLRFGGLSSTFTNVALYEFVL